MENQKGGGGMGITSRMFVRVKGKSNWLTEEQVTRLSYRAGVTFDAGKFLIFDKAVDTVGPRLTSGRCPSCGPTPTVRLAQASTARLSGVRTGHLSGRTTMSNSFASV